MPHLEETPAATIDQSDLFAAPPSMLEPIE
jgi:hypothetical protein